MKQYEKLYQFLVKQKPICSQNPIKLDLDTKFKSLRLKYKHEYGFDMLGSKCPNIHNCVINNKGCIGRPFPKDADIYQALTSLNVELEEGEFRGKEVYLAKATVECENCPVKEFCNDTCATQRSYLERHVKPKMEPRIGDLVSFDAWEQGKVPFRMLTDEDKESNEVGTWVDNELPWDCLTERQSKCIKMSLYEGHTHRDISYLLGINTKTVSEHISRAKDKFKEWGLARKALIQDHNRYAHSYYVDNMNQSDIAIKYKVHIQSVKSGLSRWRKRNGI